MHNQRRTDNGERENGKIPFSILPFPISPAQSAPIVHFLIFKGVYPPPQNLCNTVNYNMLHAKILST